MEQSHTSSDILLLDNPIWHALSTEQRHLSQGNSLAKRFPNDVAPFGALANQSAASYEALQEVFPEKVAALFLDAKPVLPPIGPYFTAGKSIRWFVRRRFPETRIRCSGN